MNIPSLHDPKWRDILQGKADFEFDSLALKILVGRLQLEVNYDQSDEVLQEAVTRLHNFFLENTSLVNVQKDLIQILGKEAK